MKDKGDRAMNIKGKYTRIIKKTISFLMVLVMLLGIFTTTSVRAAQTGSLAVNVATISKVNLNALSDSKYAFTLMPNSSTTIEPWDNVGGVSNIASSSTSHYWLPQSDAYSGNIGCWLRNCGEYKGIPIDAKLTFSWVTHGDTYTPFIRVAFMGGVMIGFYNRTFAIKYDLYNGVSGEPISVDMSLMFNDIDGTEHYAFQPNDGTVHDVQCTSDSYLYYLKSNNRYWMGSDDVHGITDNLIQTQMRYEIDNISSYTVYYCTNTEGDYVSEFQYVGYPCGPTLDAATDLIKTAYDKFINGDKSSQNTLAYTSIMVISSKTWNKYTIPTPSKTLDTQVTDDDGKTETIYTSTEKEIGDVSSGGSNTTTHSYCIGQEVPNESDAGYYDTFIMSDVLPKTETCHDAFLSAKVIDTSGTDVSERFTITYDKDSRKVSAEALSTVLATAAFYNTTYKLIIDVAFTYDADALSYELKNTGNVTVLRGEESGGGNTNDVTVTSTRETVELQVTKKWNDYNDADGIRPAAVNVILKADGTKTGEYSITKAGNWTLTVDNLNKYADGKEISYTWEESAVEGYTADIKTEDYDTVITNSHTPKYKITTEIDNGTITDTETDIPYGESRTITWTPESGYYIDSVTVDGKETGVDGTYTFDSITSDHKVVVKTLPYHTVTTAIDNGIITDTITAIKMNEDRTVSWTPESGYYVSGVTVDGENEYTGVKTSGYPTFYEFTDITEDHDVKVETKLIPSLTITKSSDKESYNCDDTVTYTIIAEQTIKDAEATNVVITDKDFTEGLEFDLTTVSCSNEEAVITTNEDGTFTVKIPNLKDEVIITVKGKVNTENLKQSDITNRATAVSDQTDEISSETTGKITYTIKTDVVNGTILENITGIPFGESRTVTYKADDGYRIVTITVDGMDVDVTDENSYEYTFDEIKANHDIRVVYEIIPETTTEETTTEETTTEETTSKETTAVPETTTAVSPNPGISMTSPKTGNSIPLILVTAFCMAFAGGVFSWRKAKKYTKTKIVKTKK